MIGKQVQLRMKLVSLNVFVARYPPWEDEVLVSINSREEFSQDTNHSAEDISRLLTERHGLESPPARKERIRWPKSNDSAWEEFDLGLV